MKQLITLLPLALLVACAEERVIDGNDLQNGNYRGVETTGSDPSLNQVDASGRVSDVIDPSVYHQTDIQGDSDRIVLSNFSQEQQARDRANYAAQLDVIEANRVDIHGAPVAQVDTSINVAAYARSTNNQLGQKIYSRSGKKGNCRAYGSADAAQRAFLSKGGPSTDPLGLDADGDGFACDFNPTVYRRLSY